MSILEVLLTGAAGAAFIKLLDNIIQWKLNRKAKQEDKEEADLEKWREETDKKINALMEGQRYILLDRIQHLGRAYLKDGEVDFDDRRRLHQMHSAYHDLGGNGDLNALMDDVDELPLKK